VRSVWHRMGRVSLVMLLVIACTAPGSSSSPSSSPEPRESAAETPTPSAVPTASPSPGTTATAQPTLVPTPTNEPTPAPTPTPVVHIVVAGDSLSLIALRYDTTWQSVVYWNLEQYASLDPASSTYDPNLLLVGWRLVVWPGVTVDYQPPLPTPAPVPPAQAPSVLVHSGSRSSGMVALTFDLGGRTDPAVAIMSWLRDHDVPATIFMTGSSVDTTTAARTVLSIVNARPDLFDLGNHSYSHPDMTTLSAAAMADELARAEAAIDRYATQSPRPLFRPPYGAWDTDVLAVAGISGYALTVMWDVDTIDWKPISDGGPTAGEIVATVLERAQGGSIVLMHLGGYETLDALPQIVTGLRARGYALVTLDRLLDE
jgi:peptidoglycan-N-acetylglucosamine deacetylase